MSDTQQCPPNASRFHRLRSAEVVGGFLDGLKCHFTDGLNCFIGARGTGKTTALEFVRYAMDDLPEGPSGRRIESLIKQNLAGGRIQLAVETRDGLRYLISRTADEEPIVLTADGEPTNITLRNGGLFRADIYSQNEVESIADESVSQLELLDNFERERVDRIEKQMRNLHSDLATNATHTAPLQEQIAALEEELGTLPGVEDRLKALSHATGSDADCINKAHEEKALRDREERAVREVADFVDNYSKDLEELQGRITERDTLFVGKDVLSGPNGESFEYLHRQLQRCGRDIDRLLRQADERLGEVKELLADWTRELDSIHDRQELAFRELIEKHEQAQGQAAERTRLEKVRNGLLEKGRKLQELKKRRRDLAEERTGLLERLSELCDERFRVRQEVVGRINGALEPAIRVRIEQFGNPARYRKLLEEALKGAGIQRRVVGGKLASSLSPAALSQAVQDRETRTLIDQGGVNENQAEKIIAALSDSETRFKLETVELLDLPRIELKDGDTYKDSLELSTGQKCTTILPILLLGTENPLLIDQPEDNLDNGFIYDAVVKSIRDVKKRRQLIFVTHNPNIPVLGDAERVFVLESDGLSARKVTEGSVDDCKQQIVDLLEGGEEAFKERRRRYQY